MALTKRKLKVTISMPSGDVVLDENLALRVSIDKAALALQQRASIEVMGMTTSLRLELLSQFTAWHRRQVSSGQVSQDWIQVKIEAGYEDVASDSSGTKNTRTSLIFTGYVVSVDPTSPPPNIGVILKCYSRQIDKTSFPGSALPTETTFKNLATLAAAQMGVVLDCQTSYDDRIVQNGFRTVYTMQGFLIGIQDQYRPDVIAFVDNDILTIRDKATAINTAEIAEVTEFIGAPTWNEWGVDWVAIMDPTIRLVTAAKLTSEMNPGINGKYIIYQIQYTLSSRETPFYMRVFAALPA